MERKTIKDSTLEQRTITFHFQIFIASHHYPLDFALVFINYLFSRFKLIHCYKQVTIL
jgi:hypothetical protein